VKHIPLLKVNLPSKSKLFNAVSKVIDSGIIAEGEFVYDFENKFATNFGYNNVLALNSGTSALHLALKLSGVKPGDEVISTSMTAEPTNTSILQAGGIPIFADICYETGNIDPESIKKVITEKTRAIVVVHYAGYPAEIKKIKKIAADNNIKIIEDCAHALGAMIGNKPVGSFGDFGIFSFQAIKHLTTIDGGILISKRSRDYSRAKKLRWFGLSKSISRESNRITEAGFKYNFNNFNAAIGLEQLKMINSKISKYISNGEYLHLMLEKRSSKIKPATILSDVTPTFWFFTGFCKDSKRIISKLNQAGIQAAKVHLPNHLHPIFKSSVRIKLEQTNQFYHDLIHLPTGHWVNNRDRAKMLNEILKL